MAINKKDKSTVIRESLKTNPGIITFEAIKKPFSLEDVAFPQERIEFYVAPIKGLYTADELNEFMEGLIPSLKADTQEKFISGIGKYKWFQFGFLWYDEKFADVKVTESTIFIEDKRCTTASYNKAYIRRSIIRPYPNSDIARDVSKEKIPFRGMYLEDFMRYKPQAESQQKGLIQRLLGR